MKMTVAEIIKKSSVEDIAKIIGSVVAMHIDGISAEEATKLDYKETLKVLQSEMEVDYQPTNADRIHSMSDEELAELFYSFQNLEDKVQFCKNKTERDEILDDGKEIPDNMCKKCLVEWLQSEVEE